MDLRIPGGCAHLFPAVPDRRKPGADLADGDGPGAGRGAEFRLLLNFYQDLPFPLCAPEYAAHLR